MRLTFYQLFIEIMSKTKQDLTKYTGDSVGLIGLNREWKLCHIPFLIEHDVFGALALQGSSGTGKTTIVKKLGILNELATGEGWGIYSADKARYEDFVGCPIPNKETHKMDIFTMPNSIATKSVILIDEINRATYENQEKWLSLIAGREIDGFKTKIRYVFTAMNPVMGTDNDVYEGVQPLDKALGERMIGLIDIPSLGSMEDSEKRKMILKSAVNQTRWHPTEELVQLHIDFISRAREHYEEAKYMFLEQVAEYVDIVQSDLRKETKNTLKIEARRAQFMLMNILATYALEAASKAGTNESKVLESAAEAALLSSFPNTLWEQNVNKAQLSEAHKRAKGCLTISLEALKSGIHNQTDLLKAISEVLSAVSEGKPKEVVSKMINVNLPLKESNVFNYFSYVASVVDGLTDSGKQKQTLMKEQEFSRFEKIYNEIVESPEMTKYKALSSELSTIHEPLKKEQFIAKNYPDFVLKDLDSSESDQVSQLNCVLENGYFNVPLAMIEMNKIKMESINDLMTFVDSISEGSAKFHSIRESYAATK